MNALTAEQKLKLQLMQVIAGKKIGMQLLFNPSNIDKMFRVAE
jgi:hypothetical protein